MLYFLPADLQCFGSFIRLTLCTKRTSAAVGMGKLTICIQTALCRPEQQIPKKNFQCLNTSYSPSFNFYLSSSSSLVIQLAEQSSGVGCWQLPWASLAQPSPAPYVRSAVTGLCPHVSFFTWDCHLSN